LNEIYGLKQYNIEKDDFDSKLESYTSIKQALPLWHHVTNHFLFETL